MFDVTIVSPRREVFEGQASSVFLPGDEGEFEILELHRTVISLLSEGDIIIDGEHKIPIKSGVMNFQDNRLVSLVEEE